MSIAEKLTTLAQNQQKVYDAGKQAEYDRFWDSYQDNGARTDYVHAFSRKWKDDAFRPKYTMKPLTMDYMFVNTEITNLKDKLDAQGVTLDTSECKSFLQSFMSARIKHIPTLDLRSSQTMANTFSSGCRAVTIDKLIVSETTPFVLSTFQAALYLQNITVEGTIGKSIELYWSPLTKNSIESVINALSTTASGLTASFSKDAVSRGFDDDGWNTLVAKRPNWTIILA
ncbi:MAG: hypothetical protein IJO28_02640 [Oscillospiraceae bacterium]|nr:hypothetical protein [Oscillospiraceae bacterium]